MNKDRCMIYVLGLSMAFWLATALYIAVDDTVIDWLRGLLG